MGSVLSVVNFSIARFEPPVLQVSFNCEEIGSDIYHGARRDRCNSLPFKGRAGEGMGLNRSFGVCTPTPSQPPYKGRSRQAEMHQALIQ